jgi:hypothetical protein
MASGVCWRDGYRAREEAAIFLGCPEDLGDLSGEASELGVPGSPGNCLPKIGRWAVASGSNRSEARVWEETKKKRRRMWGYL